jgi:hypothetical protein
MAWCWRQEKSAFAALFRVRWMSKVMNLETKLMFRSEREPREEVGFEQLCSFHGFDYQRHRTRCCCYPYCECHGARWEDGLIRGKGTEGIRSVGGLFRDGDIRSEVPASYIVVLLLLLLWVCSTGWRCVEGLKVKGCLLGELEALLVFGSGVMNGSVVFFESLVFQS